MLRLGINPVKDGWAESNYNHRDLNKDLKEFQLTVGQKHKEFIEYMKEKYNHLELDKGTLKAGDISAIGYELGVF